MWTLRLANKKGDSLVISYVLLILIGLSIAGVVYSWLKFQTSLPEEESCPDGISLLIFNVSTNQDQLNFSVSNKGRFNVGGFFVRISNKSNANMGIYSLDQYNKEVKINEIVHLNYSSLNSYGKITFIEVQPYLLSREKVIPCEVTFSKKLT
ncbi:MAG: hypothetical protein QW273_03525 [Candidatus Pacearchaeota archaeon]